MFHSVFVLSYTAGASMLSAGVPSLQCYLEEQEAAPLLPGLRTAAGVSPQWQQIQDLILNKHLLFTSVLLCIIGDPISVCPEWSDLPMQINTYYVFEFIDPTTFVVLNQWEAAMHLLCLQIKTRTDQETNWVYSWFCCQRSLMYLQYISVGFRHFSEVM